MRFVIIVFEDVFKFVFFLEGVYCVKNVFKGLGLGIGFVFVVLF